MGKFYAVKVGDLMGVYTDWAQVKPLVTGRAGAIFKRFSTLEEAQSFLHEQSGADSSPGTKTLPSHAYAFVDGSFNSETKTFGYGGFVVGPEPERVRVEISGASSDERYASMRNVAGEIGAAWSAILRAWEHGWKRLTIFHDYTGLSAWPNGAWSANNDLTIKYAAFVNRARRHMIIDFVHVAGHSGNEGNDEADVIAKKAVGIL